MSEKKNRVLLQDKMNRRITENLKSFAFMEAEGCIDCKDPKDLDMYQNKLKEARKKYDDHRKEHKQYFE